MWITAVPVSLCVYEGAICVSFPTPQKHFRRASAVSHTLVGQVQSLCEYARSVLGHTCACMCAEEVGASLADRHTVNAMFRERREEAREGEGERKHEKETESRLRVPTPSTCAACVHMHICARV